MGKRHNENLKKVDCDKQYTLDEALDLLAETAGAKFDETVDVAIKLGIDAKKSDQMVRGTTPLPHGLGRTVRVLVFAKGEKAREAEEAGAEHVGAEDLVEQISKGWLEFDKAIATPDMMGAVSKVGKLLGPRGLMPNPKLGTVTLDVKKAIEEVKAGRVEFRVEKGAIIHAPIGKKSFGKDKLRENFKALLDAVVRAKPSTAKGTYLRGVTISSTMGPGLRLDAMRVTTG